MQAFNIITADLHDLCGDNSLHGADLVNVYREFSDLIHRVADEQALRNHRTVITIETAALGL